MKETNSDGKLAVIFKIKQRCQNKMILFCSQTISAPSTSFFFSLFIQEDFDTWSEKSQKGKFNPYLYQTLVCSVPAVLTCHVNGLSALPSFLNSLIHTQKIKLVPIKQL